MDPILHRHTKARDTAWLLLGAGALLMGLAALLLVLWLALASVRATPFDADGVRCYARAAFVTCLKTANP